MTLVVARIDGCNIYINSDSKITDDRLVRTDPLCGLLKTLILRPFVCVSFAGNVKFAESAIRIFFDRKIDDINSLLCLTLDANVESECSTDFLVATVIERTPLLFKVANKKITREKVAWIGDKDGFEFYQQEFNTRYVDLPMKDRARKAFQAVIDNPDKSTIGDFHISTILDYEIYPRHPVFIHEEYIEVHVTESQVINCKEGEQWGSVSLGTVGGGSHGISYLRTVSLDFHGVAIHFTHPKFGVLFCPQLKFGGILIRDVDGRDFANRIKSEYGIPLRGFIKLDDTKIQLIDTRDSIAL